MVQTKKTTTVSAGLPPSDLLFLLRGQMQGSVKVRSMKVSTNQWHNYGSKSCLDLIVLNARTVKRQKEEVEEFQKREERKGGNDYFNLVFTYVIFNMREVAISPKYNFEKY